MCKAAAQTTALTGSRYICISRLYLPCSQLQHSLSLPFSHSYTLCLSFGVSLCLWLFLNILQVNLSNKQMREVADSDWVAFAVWVRVQVWACLWYNFPLHFDRFALVNSRLCNTTLVSSSHYGDAARATSTCHRQLYSTYSVASWEFSVPSCVCVWECMCVCLTNWLTDWLGRLAHCLFMAFVPRNRRFPMNPGMRGHEIQTSPDSFFRSVFLSVLISVWVCFFDSWMPWKILMFTGKEKVNAYWSVHSIEIKTYYQLHIFSDILIHICWHFLTKLVLVLTNKDYRPH